MSMEFAKTDVRATLVKTKYFSLHPKPLERWLWKQGIPQAAERVFWLHWEEGMKAGTWCSEIPVRKVARECAIDPSTVTRAYQLLKSLGLLKREDPGRDPMNPFCQATAITEVRLPSAFLTELSSSPNRAASRKPAAALDSPPRESFPSAPELEPKQPPRSVSDSRKESRAMWDRASAKEKSLFYIASRDRLTNLTFDEDTRLTPEDRGQILNQLTQLAAARPSPTNPRPPPPQSKPAYSGQRTLSTLELARLRRQIMHLIPTAETAEILRQVTWAVEEGALRRFPERLALNIALKKLREGAWSKPNRMPPQWFPRSTCRSASPEQCGAA